MKSADAEKTKKGERGMAADRASKGERKQDAARFEAAGGREALGCKKNDGRRGNKNKGVKLYPGEPEIEENLQSRGKGFFISE